MKSRVVYFFAFFLFLSLPTFASSFKISLEPICGFRNGNLGEYVYYSNPADKLSYLKWDLKKLFFVGGRIGFSKGRISSVTTIKSFFSTRSGIMQDSDWKNSSERSVKTHFSEHDNYLNSGFSIEHEFSFKSYPIENNYNFSISPSFGFEFQSLSMSAKYGTCWYGKFIGGKYCSYDDVENRTEQTLLGKVIDYERQDFYLWIGCGADYSFNEKLIFSASASLSPFFYSTARDFHLARTPPVYFLEIQKSLCCAQRLKFQTQYNINSRVALKFEALYLIMDEINSVRSYESYKKNSDYVRVSSSTGISTKYSEINFGIKISF